MSDPRIKEKNEREFELLLKRKEKLGKKEQQQQELLRSVELDFSELRPESIIVHPPRIEGSHFIITPNYLTTSSEIEYRVQNLEEKVKWLLEDKITFKSDEFMNVIKEEFSLISFIREIYGTKTTSGFNLVIVHDEENNNIALQRIMKAKLNLKKKLPNIYLELTVLHISDFNKKEWESRQIIFQRN